MAYDPSPLYAARSYILYIHPFYQAPFRQIYREEYVTKVTDYIFLMHKDVLSRPSDEAWNAYFQMLHASGCFLGGSAIGDGITVRSVGIVPPVSEFLDGFIRVRAKNIEDARKLLDGNPVLDAGGTVEIRELPETE